MSLVYPLRNNVTHVRPWLWIVFGVVLSIWLPSGWAFAQAGRLPKVDYYVNFSQNAPYYLADYKDAYKRFSRGSNSAYKLGTRRHLDSVCFWTMMGECHYHVGDYAKAITMYEQALALYLSYQSENWQSRLQLPPTIQANNNAYAQARITWGVPKRQVSLARMPDSFSMLFGRLDADRVLQEGGLVQNAEIYKVDVVEIMRCTALCLHRRRQIKGPIAKFDPFTSQLVGGLRVAGAGDGSIMGAYNGVLLGIAQASMEDWDKAARTLNASLQLKRMDHSLTPVALVELANIGLVTKNYAVASELALEASYSAAVFSQYDLVEEALGIGTTIHLMRSRTPYPPLENAVKWAGSNKARLLQASLIVKLAECFAESGDAVTALKVLRQASGPINNRNSLPDAVVSARLKYVGALTEFLQGDFRGGMSGLAAALKHFQTGSLWLYRLGLADQLAVAGSITQRQSEQLYSSVLRDPNDFDWQTDPMESIAFLASPHVVPMERWFDIVVDRKNHRQALEIGDLVRRHRFFSYLPFGGRLMAFRWVIHAPEEALTPNALVQRQKFLGRNPNYKQLTDQAEMIRNQLLALPIKPASKSPEEREQLKLLKELASISETQEAILASFALRREPAEMAFPPQLAFSSFQEKIPADQIAMVSLATSSGYHVFLLTREAIQYVGLSDGRMVVRSVGGLLKKLGLMDAALDVKTLQEEEWREPARELKKSIFGEGSDANWEQFKELVIVPDGVLWYLPYEVIPIGAAGDEKYLSDIVNVRYSPSLFLAFGPQRPARPLERSAVVTARMHARGEADLSKIEFEKLAKAMPKAVSFDRQIRIPSNYLASLIDQLVVWSEIRSTKNLPLTMSPMQIDQGKVGTSIEGWMSLPWWGPEHVVMPGFHSDGGAGLRGKLNGNDLFLTSMGLMASGSRTALISRWATGGKTSLELTGQYASKLGDVGATKAILAARKSTRELDLDYENEPRIRFKKTDPVLKAEHPFFWASHMLFGIPDNRPPEPEQNEAAADAKPGNDPAAADGKVDMKAADEKDVDGKNVDQQKPPEVDAADGKNKAVPEEEGKAGGAEAKPDEGGGKLAAAADNPDGQ